MIAAIMQPYFFPYIAYFQLMAACDVFVVRDDVQYIKGGWVNRNRILVEGRPQWLTLPVAHADHQLPINRRQYLLDRPTATKLRRRLVAAYEHAPHFSETIAVVDAALEFCDSNVARFNTHLLTSVALRLGIDTPTRFASSIVGERQAGGQQAVIEICSNLGASGYVNPIGGVGLYDPVCFESRGITLRFLRSSVAEYPQFGALPVPSLSVIDVMMFNSLRSIKEMLTACDLIAGRSEKTARTLDGGKS
jgi:hypothetical protein